MYPPDNVVKMPALLKRLAERANKAAHAYEAAGKAVIASIIDYGEALREGRAEFASDEKFGQWIVAEGLDRIKPFDQQPERNCAMKIAELSSHGKVLWDDCRRSRPTDIMSWWRDRQREREGAKPARKPRPSPTKDRVKEVIRAYKAEHGNYPTRDQLDEAAVAKIHHATSDQAIGELRAEEETRLKEIAARERAVQEALEAKAAETVKFTKAQQSHIDAAIRRRVKELDKEAKVREDAYEQRLRAAASAMFVTAKEKAFPDLQEQRNRAFQREETYRKMIETKAIFTEAEFGNIRNCLHPDNSASEEKRRLAFTTFNLKKLQLTGKP